MKKAKKETPEKSGNVSDSEEDIEKAIFGGDSDTELVLEEEENEEEKEEEDVEGTCCAYGVCMVLVCM